MYLYHTPLPDPLFQAIKTAVSPLVARYGLTAHASFMSEVEETKTACREILPALQEILPGPYGWFRLVGLRPSQQIVAHADPPIPGDRYHLPILTNSGCWTFHAGVWQRLEVGSLYQMSPAEPHGAVNWGDTLRVHLLLDTSV